MSKSPSDRQITFIWSDPDEVLRAEGDRGDILFEAPDVSRIVVKGRVPRLPRVKQRAVGEPESMGLPFTPRTVAGRVMCWSCACEIVEGEAVRVAPGMVSCPGCGARIPFAE